MGIRNPAKQTTQKQRLPDDAEVYLNQNPGLLKIPSFWRAVRYHISHGQHSSCGAQQAFQHKSSLVSRSLVVGKFDRVSSIPVFSSMIRMDGTMTRREAASSCPDSFSGSPSWQGQTLWILHQILRNPTAESKTCLYDSVVRNILMALRGLHPPLLACHKS